MRIALVAREVYPYVGGGIAPIVAAAARQLATAADVTVVTSAAHRPEHERLVGGGDPRVPPGVRWVFVEEPSEEEVAGWFSFMHAWSARVDAALREAFPDRGPDLIEFCDYLGEGFVTIQARHTQDPWLADTLVCVRLHTTAEFCSVLDGALPDDFATVAIYDAERYCLRRADRLLWSGGDVLDTYRRYYGEDALAPATRIPDAFLVEQDPGPGAGVVPDEQEPLRLLYLGRLERRKGVQNLIRAMTALPRDDVRLVLLGGDTDTGPLAVSLRRQLELMVAGDERVELFDSVPRSEVSEWIRLAHVVVVPSLWECWPNTAREALMLNRPLLAAPVGGLVEMVRPGRSGWLAADTSPAALAEAIERLAAYPEDVADLIREGGPRAVWEELTDPAALVRRYGDLVASRAARPAPRPRSRPPLVSIVIPYFALAAHVAETVRSALAQTHRELEVVIVNDGSFRSEDDVVYALAADPRVRVVTQPNSGLGEARNFGIRTSLGEYVLPLDADDTLDPTFVQRCLEALERDPELAYATCWTRYVHADGTPFELENAYQPFGNWSRLIERNNVGGTCSALIRRSVFDAGHRYSRDLTSYEDWFLYRDLSRAGIHGAVVPERLFRYRVRDDSMMRKVGQPLLERLVDEMRAHVRESEVAWVAPAHA